MAARASGYDAFISYSHALDGKLAPTLQRELERFAKPWYRLRSLRVFRDNASLSANPGIWSSIERALADSQWLLLMASPEAARSPWVDREVSWWLTNRSAHRLLVVLTSGELVWDEGAGDVDWAATTALPPTLRGALREEPRWVDLRWLREVEQVDRSNPQLSECVADVAAALRGVPKDLVVGEHIKQHRRTMRFARGAVTTLVLLLVLVLIAAFTAVGQRNEARKQTGIAQHQRRDALSRQLAAEALGVRDIEPERAVMLALAGWQTSPTVEARSALLSMQVENYQGRFVGHTGRVWGVAISPDGATVATAGADHTVRLWDIATHREVARFQTGQQNVKVAFSPDGALLASTSWEATGLRLWDVSGRREVAQFLGAYVGVQFSPNGQRLAAGSMDGSVRLIDVATRAERGRLIGHDGLVFAVAFTPDGATLITGGDDHSVRRWDLATQRQTAILTDHSAPVQEVAISPDGRFLASSAQDATIRLWTLPDLKPWDTRRTGESPWGLAFSPDSSVLMSTSANRMLETYDVLNRIRLPNLASNTDTTTGLAMDRTGQYLVTTGRKGTDGLVYAWSLRRHALLPHTGAVTALAFDPTGRTMATSSEGTTTRLWSVATAALQRVLAGHSDRVNGVVFSPDGLVLATASLDRTLRLWNPTSGEELARLSAENQQLIYPVFSPDGSLLAAVAAEGLTWPPLGDAKPGVAGVAVWDVRHRELLTILGTDNQLAGHPKFSRDGSLLAASLLYGRVRVWRIADRSLLADIPLSREFTSAVAFSPDSTVLAVGGSDGIIRFFDVATQHQLGSITGSSAIRDLAFSPDGRALASAGQEPVVRLWDIDSKTLLATLDRHASSLNTLAFSPDGQTLATGGTDAVAYLWNLDAYLAEHELCQVISGAPIAEEWARLTTDHGPPPRC